MADSEPPQTLHPAVELLLKRMETHPEEFVDVHGYVDAYEPITNRWGPAISRILAEGSAEDWQPIKTKLREIRMNNVHEHIMDELCNGEARRIEAEKARIEAEKNRKNYELTRQNVQVQDLIQRQISPDQLQIALGQLQNQNWGLVKLSPPKDVGNGNAITWEFKKCMGEFRESNHVR